MKPDQRSRKPGRREYDNYTCPWYSDHCRQLEALWSRTDAQADKTDVREDVKDIREELKTKMDKATFWKVTGLAGLGTMILASVLGWLLLEAYANNGRSMLLQANQTRLMEHFKLAPVEDVSKARDIITGGN